MGALGRAVASVVVIAHIGVVVPVLGVPGVIDLAEAGLAVGIGLEDSHSAVRVG